MGEPSLPRGGQGLEHRAGHHQRQKHACTVQQIVLLRDSQGRGTFRARRATIAATCRDNVVRTTHQVPDIGLGFADALARLAGI